MVRHFLENRGRFSSKSARARAAQRSFQSPKSSQSRPSAVGRYTSRSLVSAKSGRTLSEKLSSPSWSEGRVRPVLIAQRTFRARRECSTSMSSGAKGAGLPCSTSVPSKSVLMSRTGGKGRKKVRQAAIEGRQFRG